jgi:hypothetical protein
MKARVFLSCGQDRVSQEPEIAFRVKEKVVELGFECYVAVAEQSLLGLRENIFSQLQASDYLIFIDFKRDRLDVTELNVHRGSLFSHQELAIASYLQIPALVLQEDGVKPLDGMLRVLQANPIPFSDRRDLDSIVAKQLRQKIDRQEWSTQSRNTLSLHLPECPFSDALQVGGGKLRHFLVSVKNNHWRKQALGCFAYLEAVEDLRATRPIKVETIEFKWSGSTLPSVRVEPLLSRRFDAFQFTHTNPIAISFKLFTDSTEYFPQIVEPGRYKLTFAVMSQTFEPARASFVLEYGQTLDSIRFEPAQ